MEKLSALISCLLLRVGAATAQTDPAQSSVRPLPQWLTGIIAVSAFLFLTFVGFLVKKAWCEESSGRTSSEEAVRENEFVMNAHAVRSKDETNAFDNPVMDADDHTTAM